MAPRAASRLSVVFAVVVAGVFSLASVYLHLQRELHLRDSERASNLGPEEEATVIFKGEREERPTRKRNLDSVGENRRSDARTLLNTEQDGPSPQDDLVVIYNRVPKTGSTSFVGVAYDLCAANQFNVLHLNVTKNQHIMSLADQMRFVQNVTGWTVKKPALYHGHLAFLEFSRFGVGGANRPIYINVIRRPLDRLVSYYYFMRYGDDFRPQILRRKHKHKEGFDECVRRGGADCDPINLWMQIPFFCGQSAKCWEPGSDWALSEAKSNLVREYLLVGLTEELGTFIAILEVTLPRFFHGAFNTFINGNRSHLRRTTNKIEPLPETVMKIQSSRIWQMEEEFYDFAYDHFQLIKRKTLEWNSTDDRFVARKQQFHYEKIRPK